MIFVMIMPLVELIVVAIKIAKIPVVLWMSSAKRAARRLAELKQDLSISNPFRGQDTKWDTHGKYI